jgi:pyruvate formate lyase activating enzyme
MGKQNRTEGIISKIKRFSVHDGPGIRTSVFLKGCPLNCIWCHNPEGIDSGITVWHDRNLCIGCNQCVEGCPESALKLKVSERPQILIDRNLCKLNGKCVKNCPTGAISFTGYKISSDEVIREIEKDILFYETSGGGVTLTGGEPLYQPDFSIEILKACRKRKIHTAIETSLHCERTSIDYIMDFTDLFIADLKLADPALHLTFTGVTNNLILENFRYIAASGKNIIVRIPLIGNITDQEDNLSSIKEFVDKTNRNIKIEFISFNPLTRNNYDKLNIPFRLDLY